MLLKMISESDKATGSELKRMIMGQDRFDQDLIEDIFITIRDEQLRHQLADLEMFVNKLNRVARECHKGFAFDESKKHEIRGIFFLIDDAIWLQELITDWQKHVSPIDLQIAEYLKEFI